MLITGRVGTGKFDPRMNNTPISDKETALVTVCNDTAPPPLPADPTWYAVTQTQGDVWTDSQACVVVNVTGTRPSPFFYGWNATVDLTAAKARVTGANGTANAVTWSPLPNGVDNYSVSPATFEPPQDTYTLTSGFHFALRPTGGASDSKTVTACVTAG